MNLPPFIRLLPYLPLQQGIMSTRIHTLDRTKSQVVCDHCRVPVIVRHGRLVCPIAWREAHGGKQVQWDAIERAERLGKPIKHTRARKLHVIGASDGVMSCSCGLSVLTLPNGAPCCPTQEIQALKGIVRQQAVREKERSWLKAQGKSFEDEGRTDADLGLAATSASREYRTLGGRKRGGAGITVSDSQLQQVASEPLSSEQAGNNSPRTVADGAGGGPAHVDGGVDGDTAFVGKVRDLRTSRGRISRVPSV